jgi:hypothetical protein
MDKPISGQERNIIDSNQCGSCAHLIRAEGEISACAAFPDGIPYDILMGYVLHDDSTKGDRGVKRVSMGQFIQ